MADKQQPTPQHPPKHPAPRQPYRFQDWASI